METVQSFQPAPDGWTIYNSSMTTSAAVIKVTLILSISAANILNLVTFKRFKDHKPQYRYMLALSIADLMIVIPNCACTAIQLVGFVSLTGPLCFILGIATILPYQITVGLHTAMTIDKVVSILSPTHYNRMFKQTARTSGAVLLTTFIVVLCFILPFLFDVTFALTRTLEFYFDETIGTCYIIWDPISMICLSPFTIIPLVVQAVTQSLIIHKLYSLRAGNRKRVAVACATVTATVAIFYTTWVPHAAYAIQTTFYGHHSRKLLYWSTLFLTSHSCVSSLIYIVTITEYKEIVSRMFVNSKNKVGTLGTRIELNGLDGRSIM